MDNSYPSDSKTSDIVQTHRIFYDTEYIYPSANGVKTVNGSWDNSIKSEYIFVRCNEWLNKYMGEDHGVTFAVSEYAVKNINTNVTAVTYASHLGEFANNGVEFFTPWDWNVGMWEVIHLFSRYSKEFSIKSNSSDEELVSAYTSINSTNDSKIGSASCRERVSSPV